MTASASFSPAAEEVCTESSFSGVSRARYSASKSAQISSEDISPPSSSVCCWTTRLNSICSRRGSSSLVLGLHDVGHAALAGLAVHPDHGLVGATDVLRVDRQVRHLPLLLLHGYAGRGGVALEGLEALLDRVLVRAGERRVDQVTAVRVPLVHGRLVAVLDGATDLVDVGEVDLGSTPWVNRFSPRVTRHTLPVRSPLPNRQPSIRSAPAW